MNFIRHTFRDRGDNLRAMALLVALVVFYLSMNAPFFLYMKENASQLSAFNPFYGAPFTLNLFNFDPSMYYGNNPSIIHPFLNFLSVPFGDLAQLFPEHLFFAVVQSVLNALSAVMMYYYIRNAGSGTFVSLLYAVFFGAASYSLFSALIPDSYLYAQFILILSVLYLQYSRLEGQPAVGPNASLALANFAVTSTNVAPFMGALFFNLFLNQKGQKHHWRSRFYRIASGFAVLAAGLTLLQYLIFRKTWIQTWISSLFAGGFSYVAFFSPSEHWKAFYMLIASPVVTPDVALIEPSVVAFATDLTQPYSPLTHVVGVCLAGMALLGFIRHIRSPEGWTLMTFILFGFGLHLVVGYGLASFRLDLYLYAGHYLFAFFLLGAVWIGSIERPTLRKAAVALVLLCTLATLGNNIVKHGEVLQTVKAGYASMGHSAAPGEAGK